MESILESIEMMEIEDVDTPAPNNNNNNYNNNNNTMKEGKRKKKKKKKKKKNSGASDSDGVDIDRYVQSVCKRLRERKSYMVYTAVGVVGVSVFSQLLKEVDAVQACGGQKTVLGDRYRTPGGILWNLLKSTHPIAYKDIISKANRFQKQFRRPNTVVGGTSSKPVDDIKIERPPLLDSAQLSIKEKRGPVCDRIRVPVSYDDLPGEEPPIHLS